MKQAYFILGLILGVAIAIFALWNTAAVEVRSLAWQAQGSLALVVLVSASAGLLIALLFLHRVVGGGTDAGRAGGGEIPIGLDANTLPRYPLL